MTHDCFFKDRDIINKMMLISDFSSAICFDRKILEIHLLSKYTSSHNHVSQKWVPPIVVTFKYSHFPIP